MYICAIAYINYITLTPREYIYIYIHTLCTDTNFTVHTKTSSVRFDYIIIFIDIHIICAPNGAAAGVFSHSIILYINYRRP